MENLELALELPKKDDIFYTIRNIGGKREVDFCKVISVVQSRPLSESKVYYAWQCDREIYSKPLSNFLEYKPASNICTELPDVKQWVIEKA